MALRIPVNSNNEESVMKWLSTVYIGSRVDSFFVINNIKLNNDPDKSQGSYEIEIEISNAYIPELDYGHAKEKKNRLEDRLAQLYFAIADDITIPTTEDVNRSKIIVGKMLVALKGRCDIKDVKSLDLLEEKILNEKYRNRDNARFRDNSNNLDESIVDDIEEIEYVYPAYETWKDVINAMGCHICDSENNNTVIICAENIKKTIRFLCQKQDFREKIIDSIKAYIADGDEDSVFAKASYILEGIVLSHELGHMIFRSMNDLDICKKEALADWVACLFADTLQREIRKELVPYQGDDYQGFIAIPDKYGLKKEEYCMYCDKINELLENW